MEKLFTAVNHSAVATLAAVAHRIAATAQPQGMDEVAQIASQIENAAANNADLLDIAQMANELMEACAPKQEEAVV